MTKPIIKAPAKKNRTGKNNFNFIQKILIFLALILVIFTVLPAVVVLLIGLLPTLTIVITDTKNINKITTVGCFNIAGIMIRLNNIFVQFNSGIEFSIRDNIFNIIIMLGAAALGVLLYYVLPDLFVFIFKNSAQHRLKVINTKLEKLSENWANILPEEN